ncbi:MAG: hypothetical protein ACREPQ_00445 [Rhodanobacter sp.]
MDNDKKERSEQVARWLDFLRHARGISLTDLALKHDIHRSNLSSFINSGGRSGWIARDKVRGVLFDLRMHTTGTLCPGLHRWKIISEVMASNLQDVLERNSPTWIMALRMGIGGGYVMARIGRLISVFAELTPEAMPAFYRAYTAQHPLVVIDLDQDGDSLTQTLWMTPSDHTVLEHFEALRQQRFGSAPVAQLSISRA